jgi:dTDP-4-amino-4,6-dideoxygalactose transaminase
VFKIPLFDLNYGIEEEEAVCDTLRSKWISIGPKCEEFENIFTEMLGVKYAASLSNCTDALHLACHVLGIRENDEVICPSLTFAATANCIKYVGAAPVFCDIKSSTDLNIDADEIEELITERTRAIIVMHYAGFPCDMDTIVKIAEKHNLKVIEDACHGPLSEYKGQKLGTIGDIGCFSFFSNKNISTGEGGMLVTNNEEIAKKVILLRSHGMTVSSYDRARGHGTGYDIVDIGFNYRMDDIRASLGCVQMKKLPADLEKRARLRLRYIDNLKDIDCINLPFYDNEEFVSNYIMPIILSDSIIQRREKVRNKLSEYGIQTSVHYPAIHRFSAYKEHYRPLPKTEYATDNEITLPMFAALSEDDVDFICEKLRECMKSI